jgi:ABC-type multidrug transport system fused ATPase/permease subunit
LDEKNEKMVIESLEWLTGKRRNTSVLITHNLIHAARADMIMYFDSGRILERGTHLDLMGANGRYAALYRQQTALLKKQNLKGIVGAYAT